MENDYESRFYWSRKYGIRYDRWNAAEGTVAEGGYYCILGNTEDSRPGGAGVWHPHNAG